MKRGMAPPISWDPLLVEGLLRGLSLSVIGQLALPEPLSRLVVLGRSDSPPDGHMALAAILVPTARGGAVALSPLGMGRHPGATRMPGEEPTSFADVGGQDAARAELETICLAVRQPDAFRAWGARPPRGVLLYGPPGTGKTLLARALAHEAGARFLQVRATDVVSKWYGEAERRVHPAVDRAPGDAPAVIFFDEIDAIA